MAPSGNPNDRSPARSLATGLSTKFADPSPDCDPLSTVRPRRDRRRLSPLALRDPAPSAIDASWHRGLGRCHCGSKRRRGQPWAEARLALASRVRSAVCGGHENARRNRRSWAESPRASSGSLKASVHRPLRARTTMTPQPRPWLPAYPRPSRNEDPNRGGFPPSVHGDMPIAAQVGEPRCTSEHRDRGGSRGGRRSRGTTKRPKEPSGPSLRCHRRKHRRLGFVEPRIRPRHR